MEKIYISKNKLIKWGIWGLLVLMGALWWFGKKAASESAWTEEFGEISVQSEMSGKGEDEAKQAASNEMADGVGKTENTAEQESQIGVHVTGAVAAPDQVYFLPEGARVADAIEAAGGASEEADLSQLNLAGYVQDGQRIYVPVMGEKIENITNTAGENPENPLTNINLATKIELLDLPGIGETYAERIIQYREENGPFETIEDIMKVKGIGESKFNDLKDKITVDE